MTPPPPRTDALIATALSAILAVPVAAEPNRVNFPGDLDALEHYTTVTRGEVTEFIYSSRKALDANPGRGGDPRRHPDHPAGLA